MTENKVSEQRRAIQFIRDELGLDESVIRQIGIGPLLTQIASTRGMPDVTRCDADSGHTGQYFGDLLADSVVNKKRIG